MGEPSAECDSVVVPALIAAILPLLSASEAERLTRDIDPEAPSTMHLEGKRLVAAAQLALVWTTRLLRWADLPDFGDAVLAEARTLGRPPAYHRASVVAVAAVYRAVLERLPIAGPQQHERLKDAVRGARLAMDAVEGCAGGDLSVLTIDALAGVIGLARMRDRTAWLRMARETVESLSGLTAGTQLEIFPQEDHRG